MLEKYRKLRSIEGLALRVAQNPDCQTCSEKVLACCLRKISSRFQKNRDIEQPKREAFSSGSTINMSYQNVR